MRSFFITVFTLVIVAIAVAAPKALAADDATNAKDAVSNAEKDGKQGVRTAKRKVRKATGTDNVLKDAKDKANDVGDDISNSADKAKNHAQ